MDEARAKGCTDVMAKGQFANALPKLLAGLRGLSAPPWPSGRRIRRGVGLAAAAALAFGVTVPLLKLASAGVGVFTCGSLLYLGAAAAAGVVVAVAAPSDAGGPLARASSRGCSASRRWARSARRRCW